MKKTLKSIDLNLISEFILSMLVLIMGVVVMIFKTFGLIEIVIYGSVLFYIYAIFSTISYFIGRKEGDYELLLLSLINIITATFMFVFKNDNPAMILGAGMTIFTIMIVANRGVKIIQLKREDNYIWIIKFIVTFLIGFLGMLTTYNLFNNVTVQTLMFGFYFISLGFMLGIESILNIFITNDKFKKILSKVLEDEAKNKLEPIKETSKKEEKIIAKSNKEKIEEVLTPTKTQSIEKKKNITQKTKTTKEVKSISKPNEEVKKVETKISNTNKTTKKVEKEKPKTIKKKETTPKIKTTKETKNASKPKIETKNVVSKKTAAKKATEIETTTKKKPGRPKKLEQ